MSNTDPAPVALGGTVRILTANRVASLQRSNEAPNPTDFNQWIDECGCRRPKTERGLDPLRGAPLTVVRGGHIYLHNAVTETELGFILNAIAPHTRRSNYAVCLCIPDDPREEGCMAQLRIINARGLATCFGFDTNDVATNTQQPMNAMELIWSFIEAERRRWGTSFHQDAQGLRGMFGGNGTDVREELSFGIAIESDRLGILRVWSRAWLVECPH